MTEIKGSYEKEGPVLVDTHGEYLESPRRVAGEMNVPFIDLNKLTHDLVTRWESRIQENCLCGFQQDNMNFVRKGKLIILT